MLRCSRLLGADIVLTSELDTGMYVRESTAILRKVELSKGGISGELRVFAPGYIQFGGVKGKVVFRINGEKVQAEPGNSLRFPLPSGSGDWLKFEVLAE